MSTSAEPNPLKSPSQTAMYIVVLRDEYLKRKSKNSSYSLSAFSKHLGVDQSLFSKILAGKKQISDRLAAELLLKAGIAPRKISSAIGGFISLDEDQFNFIADWIPFSILELAKTKQFSCQPKSIAKRLGVRVAEVSAALSRLSRFGHIEMIDEAGNFVISKPNNDWVNTKATSIARKRLQKKYLEMSLKAIDEVPYEDREHGSLTVAINRKRLPELKEKLNAFRMELGKFLQGEDELDEVYQITMSAFPLTKLGELP